jgi:hypothetical protein
MTTIFDTIQFLIQASNAIMATPKQPRMLFVISSPRSGSTMLERMLESHSQIHGGPEPHILTPLAHLGFWDKVDKAPYDHILAAESQKLFVSKLPNQDQDYWNACRAYCDFLYGRSMENTNKSICLDKTPAYGLILPFMMNVFPDAKFVVLTRHPIATFSSFANSFFDGSYETAQTHNPLLNRYVPAIARFLRQTEVPFIHVQYENLVQDPEAWMQKIYEYIEVPFEADTVNYGEHQQERDVKEGLGDPIGVQQHSRPSADSLHKWVEELSAEAEKRSMMENILQQLDSADLETLGYPLETLWQPMEEVAGQSFSRKKEKITRYRLQRKAIIRLRTMAQKNGLFRKLLKKINLASDVLLRD